MERTIQNRPGKTFSLIKTEIKKKERLKIDLGDFIQSKADAAGLQV